MPCWRQRRKRWSNRRSRQTRQRRVSLADTSAWVEYNRATGSSARLPFVVARPGDHLHDDGLVDRRVNELIRGEGPLAATDVIESAGVPHGQRFLPGQRLAGEAAEGEIDPPRSSS